MSWNWRYDPSKAKAGDVIYVASREGWSGHSVAAWTVGRVTPGGQIVCRRGNAELRINKRGAIMGDAGYGSSIVDAETAAELRAESKRKAAWRKIRQCADAVDKAARNQDEAGLRETMALLAQAIEAATAGETREAGLDAKHESAVANGDAPNNDSRRTPDTQESTP